MTSCSTFTYNSSFGTFGDLDLYSNVSANQSTPLVVYIHGGAWRTEDKQDHKQLALDFVEQGFTVAVTNYRLSLPDSPGEQPKVQHPNHIQDTLEALTFLHKSPPTSTYDKQRFFLVGHSAGAHIATMLVLDPELPSLDFVRGVIGADGIYDLPLLVHTFPTYMDFVSQAFGPDTTTYQQASPISKSPRPSPSSSSSSSSSPLLVPTLIVHSIDDQLVDIAQAESIYLHMKTSGFNVTLDSTTVKGDHYDMVKSNAFIALASAYINNIISGGH